MIYLILGGLILLVLVTAGRAGRPVRIRREWRFASGTGALACLVAAAYLGVREAWLPALALVAIGLSLAGTTRFNPRVNPRAGRGEAPPPRREAMSLAEARSILGVSPQAGREEIQAAYSRLMRMAHPDKGGTSGLAAQLNAARDRLLGG
ncbi:DnaJ domain-containing protein [Phenylobacterium soli]|uniref:DnaJ domain-containing protein n=1 Tax=Phenylobacterium soli TaxID=2170551 RepID=UPI0014033F87|nr:DnaJ domain-containing protein [Phenylobacterium soli]